MNSLVSRPIAFVLGVVVALIGDAGHVASGTTHYAASSWPDVLLSPAWFPVVVGASVVLTAQLGRQLGLSSRGRARIQLGYAALSVLGLYLLTSALRSRLFGNSARFWLNLQIAYDLALELDRLGTKLARDVEILRRTA